MVIVQVSSTILYSYKIKIIANRSDMGLESHLGLDLFQGINPTFIFNTFL